MYKKLAITLVLSTFLLGTKIALADESFGGVTWPQKVYNQLKISAAIKGYDAEDLAYSISVKAKGRFPKCDYVEDKIYDDSDKNVACYKFKCRGFGSSFAPDAIVVHNYVKSTLSLRKSCSAYGESW